MWCVATVSVVLCYGVAVATACDQQNPVSQYYIIICNIIIIKYIYNNMLLFNFVYYVFFLLCLCILIVMYVPF